LKTIVNFYECLDKFNKNNQDFKNLQKEIEEATLNESMNNEEAKSTNYKKFNSIKKKNPEINKEKAEKLEKIKEMRIIEMNRNGLLELPKIKEYEKYEIKLEDKCDLENLYLLEEQKKIGEEELKLKKNKIIMIYMNDEEEIKSLTKRK